MLAPEHPKLHWVKTGSSTTEHTLQNSLKEEDMLNSATSMDTAHAYVISENLLINMLWRLMLNGQETSMKEHVKQKILKSDN